jgi:hypothetical protein
MSLFLRAEFSPEMSHIGYKTFYADLKKCEYSPVTKCSRNSKLKTIF